MEHVEKYTKAQLWNQLKHYERNAAYDLSFNINIGNGQMDFINTRSSQIKVLNRKDVIFMCTWTITLPKQIPAADTDKFFRTVYGFLDDRYGMKNVISCFVHKDSTPHMHYAFMPVVTDKEKGIEKLSAKEVLTRTDLQSFHKDLYNYLSRTFGSKIMESDNEKVDSYADQYSNLVVNLSDENEALRKEIATLKGLIITLRENNQGFYEFHKRVTAAIKYCPEIETLIEMAQMNTEKKSK